MRIAYLADDATNNGFYRGIGPMTALTARGHEVQRLPTSESRPPLAAVRGLDVLFIHRYPDTRAHALAREAKAHGAAVVWDNDDDMGSVPRSSVAYRRFGGIQWERRLALMKRLFAHVDLVTAPSPALIERLREAGAPAGVVIENHVPLEYMRQPRAHAVIVVGWVAGLEHQLDVDRIPIVPALDRLMAERPELRVMTVGLRLGVADSARNENRHGVPLMRLTDSIAEFDIGIAPLSDIPLNHARSNIKLKEYACASVPWLASPVGPYTAMGEKQGGRLVSDDGWYEALARLVDKPKERAKLAKRSSKWVAGETLERNGEIWERTFEAVVRDVRAVAAR